MIQTIEKNLQECFASFRILRGSHLTSSSQLVAMRSEVALNFLNGVAFANFPARTADELARQTLEPYKDRGLPCRWWITPSSSPRELGTLLKSNGMTSSMQIPGMGVTVKDVNFDFELPPNFRIDRVQTLAQLTEWATVLTREFSMAEGDDERWIEVFTQFGFKDDCPWRQYIGYLNDLPVATSAVFFGSQAAGIYHVVTAPAARGLGIGSLMTLECIHDAKALGFGSAVLQSSEKGLKVYERLGFRTYFTADFLILPRAQK